MLLRFVHDPSVYKKNLDQAIHYAIKAVTRNKQLPFCLGYNQLKTISSSLYFIAIIIIRI